MWWMEVKPNDPEPKPGDLIYTAMKTSRARTWIVVKVWPRRSRVGRRFNIWKERWWDCKPRLRNSLYEAAERNGGQRVWECEPLPKKRKLTFEQYMGGR